MDNDNSDITTISSNMAGKKYKYGLKLHNNKHQIILAYFSIVVSLIVGLGLGYGQLILYLNYQAPLADAQKELAISTNKLNAASEPLLKTQVQLYNSTIKLNEAEESLKQASIKLHEQSVFLNSELTKVAKLDREIKDLEKRLMKRFDEEERTLGINVRVAEYLQFIQPAIKIEETSKTINPDAYGNLLFTFKAYNCGKTIVILKLSDFTLTKQLPKEQNSSYKESAYDIKFMRPLKEAPLFPGQSLTLGVFFKFNEQIQSGTRVVYWINGTGEVPAQFAKLTDKLLGRYLDKSDLDNIYKIPISYMGTVEYEVSSN